MNTVKASDVKAVAAVAVPRIQFLEKPSVSAIYADDFDKVVLNKTMWAGYVDYVIREGFGRLTMYSVHKFLTSANFKIVAEFILYARGRGIFSIEAVYGSLNQFKNNILAFQNWCTMRAQAIDRVNLENEPYNWGKPKSDSIDWPAEDLVRKEVFAICNSFDTKVIRWRMEATKYHGWNIPSSVAGSAQWTPAQISESIVSTTNDLLLHCYTKDPKFSQVLGRLRDFDAACVKLGKKDYHISIILSTESKSFKEKDGSMCKNEFSGLYMKTKSAEQWYLDFIAQMKTYLATNPGFLNIIIVGVYDFDMWFHKQARP